MKRVLLIGSGAREHALATTLVRGAGRVKLYCAPGNAGTANIAENLPLPVAGPAEIADLAESRKVDLVVVGPEGPLVEGAADVLRARGIACFGPGAAGARLEGSKAYAKDFLRRHKIPTADYRVFETYPHALSYVIQSRGPCVVKADGLAAGKGVYVVDSAREGEKALHVLMVERTQGEAGLRVVVEERLEGREASLFLVMNGSTAAAFPLAQDFKRLKDGDLGPNTGGMGACVPHPLATPAVRNRIQSKIIEPLLEAFSEARIDYRGLLYVGLMLTEQGPQVLEFNCRFGDPETQPLSLLCGGSWFEALSAAANGESFDLPEPGPGVALCRVIAGATYPEGGGKMVRIEGLESASNVEGVEIFHAGTKALEREIWGGPGRMLSVCATGRDVAEASARLDVATARLAIEGAQWRTDLAERLGEPEPSRRVETRVSRTLEVRPPVRGVRPRPVGARSGGPRPVGARPSGPRSQGFRPAGPRDARSAGPGRPRPARPGDSRGGAPRRPGAPPVTGSRTGSGPRPGARPRPAGPRTTGRPERSGAAGRPDRPARPFSESRAPRSGMGPRRPTSAAGRPPRPGDSRGGPRQPGGRPGGPPRAGGPRRPDRPSGSAPRAGGPRRPDRPSGSAPRTGGPRRPGGPTDRAAFPGSRPRPSGPRPAGGPERRGPGDRPTRSHGSSSAERGPRSGVLPRPPRPAGAPRTGPPRSGPKAGPGGKARRPPARKPAPHRGR